MYIVYEWGLSGENMRITRLCGVFEIVLNITLYLIIISIEICGVGDGTLNLNAFFI